MNNNGFVLLRYFRDLNQNADLLLFEDDERGFSSHFSIKSDTWKYSDWEKFIFKVPACNGYGHAINDKAINKFLLIAIYIVRTILGSTNAIFSRPLSAKKTKKLKSMLSNYDIFIGSGATPAIFESLGLKLDLFFPYSLGIENIDEEFFKSYRMSKNPVIKYLANEMYQKQAAGIVNSKYIVNTDPMGATEDSFLKLGLNPINNIPIPFTYLYESEKNDFSDLLSFTIKQIKKYDFRLISHSRHQWIKPKNINENSWHYITKNNDWIIKSFNSFLKTRTI